MIQVMLGLIKAFANYMSKRKVKLVVNLVISNCMTLTSFNSSVYFNRLDAKISNKRRCFNVSTQQNVTVSIIE